MRNHMEGLHYCNYTTRPQNVAKGRSILIHRSVDKEHNLHRTRQENSSNRNNVVYTISRGSYKHKE